MHYLPNTRANQKNESFVNVICEFRAWARRSHAKRSAIILHGKWGGHGDRLQFSSPSDIYTYSWWCKIGNIMFVLMVDTRTLSMVRQPIFETSKNGRCRMARHIFLEALIGNVIGIKFKKLTATWTKINHEVSFNKIPREARKKKSEIVVLFYDFFLTRLRCFFFFFYYVPRDFSKIKTKKAFWNRIEIVVHGKLPLNNAVKYLCGTICGFMFRKWPQNRRECGASHINFV